MNSRSMRDQHSTTIAFLLLLIASACGASSSRTAAGPTCDQVGQKMVWLAMDDNGVAEAPPELGMPSSDDLHMGMTQSAFALALQELWPPPHSSSAAH